MKPSGLLDTLKVINFYYIRHRTVVLAGHMVYMLRSEPPCAFSGDHIFVCGNGEEQLLSYAESTDIPTPGQMFEGTPATMLSSIKKMTLLPKNTLIFPGPSP